MKVLHDWDRLEIKGGWARRRGISLLLYCLVRKFNFLRKIKYLHENAERIEAEKIAYMETLIKLNKISGVDPIFGIRDIVRAKYGAEIDRLILDHDIDVRRHIHIGENSDPNRIRVWVPPLYGQTRVSWHFDTKFARGEKVVLGPEELPIFHVDRPFHLALYIDYLFGRKLNLFSQLENNEVPVNV